MPRTKPQAIQPDTTRASAGSTWPAPDEAKTSCARSSSSCASPTGSRRSAHASPRASCSTGRPGPARRCSPRRSRTRADAAFFSTSRRRASWRCSRASARPHPQAVRRAAQQARPRSSSSTSSTRSAAKQHRRGVQPRAGPDAQRAAGRARRLRTGAGRGGHRRLQPPRCAGRGPAAPRAASTARCWSACPTCAGAARSSRCTRRASRSAPGLDLQPIARQTAGLAGADLENITNEAAIHAARTPGAPRQIGGRTTSTEAAGARRRGPAGQKRVISEPREDTSSPTTRRATR